MQLYTKIIKVLFNYYYFLVPKEVKTYTHTQNMAQNTHNSSEIGFPH